MPSSNSVNHPTRMKDKPKTSTDLFQTTDRNFAAVEDVQEQETYPIGMPKGDNSDHTVNDVVQPSITVQAAIKRLKATR